ncbi:arabinosyltransferase domain-containing protein [Pseudonocardia sp. RS11V-5]|uniref:arabinosyltransferase domain-containing protein n=1 Tax=Pseudonocardia terrae TaxID=2905831 RepID=UPI001E4B7549|nr:arabinosyltransferase domain-containing protein [Pseudonocardia terrae]MCE3550369.1 arabinosyltransferase domain-containing protein [Pseudonocardia terrae]
MVSPARHAPDATREDPSATVAPRRRRGVLAALLGLVVVACAVAFPFAPVVQPEVRYDWGGPGAVPTALPLMPYQPVALTASTTCDAARALGQGTLLATTPAAPDPRANPLDGLRMEVTGGALHVTTAGVELDPVPLPAGACTVEFRSDPSATTVLLNGAPVVSRAGDLRPAVAAILSDAPDPSGLRLQLTADTRFQTSITPLKAAIAAVGVLALVAMVVVLARGERRRAVRVLPRRWWRPRLPDLAVTAVLAVWWVSGPVTVDDGYIAGIVRDRGSSGFVGNVYRWLNAPEAPFSWFYDLYYAWSQVSASTVWLRLPSVLLGLVTWGLLSRCVVPRLLPRAGRGVAWLAALTFLTWWLPYTLGLRPEPWVAVGSVLAFVGVERAIALRRVTPLVLALLVAGLTTAVTPGGLMAFAPVVAGLVPVLRTLRRSGLGPVPLVLVLLAGPAAAVFLMVYDQSLAAMLEATRVRTLIGGGQPWYDEYSRYALLLTQDDLQGSLGKRAPVLLTLLAAVAALWAVLSAGGRRIPPGPTRRIAVVFLLGLASMTATPTKWTQHFGDLAGIGAAVLLVGIVAVGRRALAGRTAPWLAGLGALAVAGSLVLAGRNLWPFVSGWWGLTWSTLPPLVGGVELAPVWLVAGLVLVAAALLVVAWRRSGGGSGRLPRWFPSPAAVTTVLLVAVVLLQVGSFARTGWQHRNSYTLLSDALSTARGTPCGLQERLSVETNPAAGLLPALPDPSGLPAVPVDAGGTELPGIRAAGTGHTAWFALDPAQRSRELPVVVTVAGALRPGDTVAAEFAGDDGAPLARIALKPDGETPRDIRLLAPEGATRVRLVVDVREPVDTPAVATLPRVPRLTPMDQVLPAGTEAILDWPVAFVFPCLAPAPLPLGTTALPQWRVGPRQDDDSAAITYTPGFGGPFAAARTLVIEQRMATYLAGDPTRDAAQVYRWVPVRPLAAATPQVTERTVGGWVHTGRTRVPGLDPVG